MKDKLMSIVKEKKNVLIILGVAVVTVILIITIVLLASGGKKPNGKEDEKIPGIQNKVEKLEDGKIEVKDFKINYNEQDKKWYLSMNITNSSDKDIDLKDYNLKLYEKDKELVLIIQGTALGKIEAKSGSASIITLDEKYKNVNYLEITK